MPTAVRVRRRPTYRRYRWAAPDINPSRAKVRALNTTPKASTCQMPAPNCGTTVARRRASSGSRGCSRGLGERTWPSPCGAVDRSAVTTHGVPELAESEGNEVSGSEPRQDAERNVRLGEHGGRSAAGRDCPDQLPQRHTGGNATPRRRPACQAAPDGETVSGPGVQITTSATAR